MKFRFSAEIVTCKDCPVEHPVIQICFTFENEDEVQITMPVSEARRVAESIFQTVLAAEG